MGPGRWFAAAVAALALALGMPVASAAPGDAGTDQPPSAPDQLLVGYERGTTASERSQARERASAELIERVVRGSSTRSEVELVRIPERMNKDAAIRRLEADPNVAYAEPNWVITLDAESNDPYYTNGSLWGMYGDASPLKTNKYGSQAGEAWDGGNVGSDGVYIGIIDEGIDYNHPDLDDNIWTNAADPVDGIDNDGNSYVDDVHGWDFHNNDSSVYDGGNSDKHGTHVSGTVAGEGGNGAGVAGVAWKATLISGKFLGPAGGYISNAVKAVNYMTDLKTRATQKLNIVATNNSWGGGGYSQSMHDAIIRSANANILFIAAAGNDGANNDSTVRYPSSYDTRVGTSTQPAASYDNVIAVAAIDKYGALASWSNYGKTNVDLGAPGVSIYSTLPKSSYGSYSGTSMATPHVTGGAVLKAALDQSITGAQLRAALLDTGVPTTSLADKTVTGDRLDVSSFVGIVTSPTPEVDGTAPTVFITSPADGTTISGTVTIEATASDDVGVASVEFFAGTESLGDPDTTEPYSISWTPADGNYALTARATDAAGNTTLSSAVNVTVDNSAGSGTGTVRVSDVEYRWYGGKNGRNHLDILVSIVDGNSQAVAGASVSVDVYRTIDGTTTLYDSATATTDSSGVAAFTAKNAPSGCYTTDVTEIVAGGLTFDDSFVDDDARGCKA